MHPVNHKVIRSLLLMHRIRIIILIFQFLKYYFGTKIFILARFLLLEPPSSDVLFC